MTQTTYTETTGSGPELVLLHGWGLHGGIFDTLLPELATRYRVTTVDLPGFGRSALPQALDLDALVAGVLDVLPAQAHLLGWSLGGMVAMALAARHPQRVARLVTVASQPCFRSKDDWPHAMALATLDKFTAQLEADYADTLQKFLALQALGSEHAKDDIRLLKETVFAHGPAKPDALRAGLKVLHDADLRGELAAIRAPWLRVYGRLDGLVPVRAAQAHAELAPLSRQHVFPKASHAPFISHRADFIAVLNDFLL
ncbi:MAG: pimeloyl-ACP methyl ester esterase BioH [Gammaproteobacteria bacterium]|nr:pimeloyl-ACP methyl ester esterase BioH [Gammaproteobacteria bacterium]